MSYLSKAEEALIEIPEGYEGYLPLVLAASREAIDDFCDRSFDLRSCTETLNGHGGGTLTLKRYPVIELHSVDVEGKSRSLDEFIVLDERQLRWKAYRFPLGKGNVVVSYTAGFVSPPRAVRMAQVLTAKAMLNAAPLDPNVLAEAGAGYSAQFHGGGAGSVPPAAQSLLMRLRNVCPA